MSRVIPALLRGGRTDCGRVAVASDERVGRVGGQSQIALQGGKIHLPVAGAQRRANGIGG